MIKNVGENIFDNEVQEIHSFDAYYKNVILRNNNLVIPYINLGISRHAINSSEEMLFLNFAYMVFVDINYLDVYVNNKRSQVINRLISLELYHFGGNYLDYNESVFNDIGISCNKVFLQTLDNTQLSNQMWIPIVLPNFKMNLEMEKVDDFFNMKYLPRNIRDLIK